MKRLVLVLLGMFILVGAANAKPNQQEKDYLIQEFRGHTLEEWQGSGPINFLEEQKIGFDYIQESSVSTDLLEEDKYGIKWGMTWAGIVLYDSANSEAEGIAIFCSNDEAKKYVNYFLEGKYNQIPFEDATFVKWDADTKKWIKIEMEE
ncbi:MAG: hypothetical protein VZQ58_06530 [Bacteroidales bacterium]|nr:hypothetical protein [Bacteroidales bacterium]